MPDTQWGELVMACVVLKRDATLTTDEFVAFCRRSLASYKVPKRVEFFRNGSAQEQFRQSAEEDLARALLEASATSRELSPNCRRPDRGHLRVVGSLCDGNWRKVTSGAGAQVGSEERREKKCSGEERNRFCLAAGKSYFSRFGLPPHLVRLGQTGHPVMGRTSSAPASTPAKSIADLSMSLCLSSPESSLSSFLRYWLLLRR
jgi:hypothetical protein